MRLINIFQTARFWRHLRYHREILKFVRWAKMDTKRATFYRALINPNELVFDVGANFGNRSKIFISLGAKVVAFEPQTYCADFLSVAFSGNPNFSMERSALSDSEGQLTMFLGEAHTLSTLDKDWIETMKNGGRFSAHQWSAQETVKTMRLDTAIDLYGTPAFIKIDVEGHEFHVISGLSQPVKSLSLEFASESLDSINKCIDHLGALAKYEYRLSFGESMQFDSPAWCDGTAIKARLERSKELDPLVWGDIYARRVQ